MCRSRPNRPCSSFFRKGNLMALRELAMRRTADRVDTQMQDYMRDHAVAHTWPVTERILVSVGPGPFSARLVRAAHRLATALHAEWLAVYVETPEHRRLPQTERDRITQALRLAEQLGAETATLSGRQVSEELLELARSRNVSKIVVGKPWRSRWRSLLFGSVVEQLVSRSGDIDVYVITAERDDGQPRRVVSDGRRDQLGRLQVGGCGDRALHRPVGADLPLLLAHQHRHGLSARRRAGRRVAGTWPLYPGIRVERARLRFLLRAAANILRRRRHPVPGDVWRDARAGGHHQHADRPDSSPGGGDTPARAPHRRALRHEPRTGRRVEQGETGRGGRRAYRRGDGQPDCHPAARYCGRAGPQ